MRGWHPYFLGGLHGSLHFLTIHRVSNPFVGYAYKLLTQFRGAGTTPAGKAMRTGTGAMGAGSHPPPSFGPASYGKFEGSTVGKNAGRNDKSQHNAVKLRAVAYITCVLGRHVLRITRFRLARRPPKTMGLLLFFFKKRKIIPTRASSFAVGETRGKFDSCKLFWSGLRGNLQLKAEWHPQLDPNSPGFPPLLLLSPHPILLPPPGAVAPSTGPSWSSPPPSSQSSSPSFIVNIFRSLHVGPTEMSSSELKASALKQVAVSSARSIDKFAHVPRCRSSPTRGICHDRNSNQGG